MEKTHWKKTFNKEYLGSHDYENDEKEKNLQIKSVEVREVIGSDGKKSKMNIAIFIGAKPMILNVTNCKTMRSITGSNYIEDWKNVNVTVFITSVSAFGETTDGLRIKNYIPKSKPELKENTQDFKNCVQALKDGHTLDEIKKRFSVSELIQSKLMEASI